MQSSSTSSPHPAGHPMTESTDGRYATKGSGIDWHIVGLFLVIMLFATLIIAAVTYKLAPEEQTSEETSAYETLIGQEIKAIEFDSGRKMVVLTIGDEELELRVRSRSMLAVDIPVLLTNGNVAYVYDEQ